MAAADAGVFLNMDEFAETHELNGVPCVCVLSRDETDEKAAAMPGAVHRTGCMEIS